MTIKRQDLTDYIRDGERLRDDLKCTIADLRFRADGGKLHVAVDFSEVHSFLIPEQPDDDWLWPGVDRSRKRVVEHTALSELMTGPPKPVLLPPYVLEFENFIGRLRAGAYTRLGEIVSSAVGVVDELHQRPDAQALLRMAASGGDTDLSEKQLEEAVRFFETYATDLVGLMRGEILEPLARTRAFLETQPFASVETVAAVKLTGEEAEVTRRFDRLRQLRGAEKEGASYLDALALEYVRRANAMIGHNRHTPEKVLLVTRSTVIRRLVDEEVKEGLWADCSFLRHPRSFAPLAWHIGRGSEDPLPKLEETEAALDLCLRSAEIRLKRGGGDDGPERDAADAALAKMMKNMKASILRLVQMGGTINESRLASKQPPAKNEVLQLLAMVRSRKDLFQAIARRMADVNDQLDREHETIGVLFHTHDSLARDIDIKLKPASNERIVLPKMGRLPYGLRFRTASFTQWLDELRVKGEVTQEGLIKLFQRALTQTADHYETLLFMAYTMALVGQYPLARDYCGRALVCAERDRHEDQSEAMFMQALCERVLADEPEQLEHALALLADIARYYDAGDPRHLAEDGNIRLRWWVLAQERGTPEWRQSAPSYGEMIAALRRAAAAAKDERLRISVLNSLCYAYAQGIKNNASSDARPDAIQALDDLLDALRQIRSDIADWPLRIKDTIAETIILTNPETVDAAFLREIVECIEREIQSDTGRHDIKELRTRVRQYRRRLAELDSATA